MFIKILVFTVGLVRTQGVRTLEVIHVALLARSVSYLVMPLEERYLLIEIGKHFLRL